ncbi:hypothetical protein ACMV8I_18670 [Ewingella sp. S1.OA.A_B6]
MVNKIAVALTALILALIAILMWAAFHYYGKTVSQQSEISVATQAKNEAEFITKTQAIAVTTFNTIAGATLNEQKDNVSVSQDRQVIIKTVLQKEQCAVVLIPAAASGSLLSHYNAIRTSASNADTGQPAATMPASAATK